jgi:hypothetical protein
VKDSTKLKVAIEAIEHRQRFFVYDANMFKKLGAEYGRNAAKEYDRLQAAKEYLQDLLAEM